MESEQGLQNSLTLDREDLELIDIVTSTSRRKSDFS